MKRKYCIIVYCSFFFLPFIVKAQAPYLGGDGNGFGVVSASVNLGLIDSLYNGGAGDGSDAKRLLNASLFITDSLYNGGNGNGFNTDTLLNGDISVADSLYNGGIGDGFSRDRLLNASLAIADSLYNGGNNNGFNTDTLLNGDLSVADSLYNGGDGDGFSIDTVLNASLGIIDSLYNGGNGNGFHQFIISNVTLYSLDSLYNGGIGRGEIQIQQTLNLGLCMSSVITWTGNIDVSWANPANWDCGVVPGINSVVIIPTGRPLYPIISASTEIRSIDLRSGSSVTVQPGVLLKLNGQ